MPFTKTKSAKSSNGLIEVPSKPIMIPRLKTEIIRVPIEGTTSLISECWSEKAKTWMRQHQMKKAKAAKEAKDPQADFEASLYTSDDGWYGMPCGAFKAALVGGCRQVEGISMTMAKRIAFVKADGFSKNQNKELVQIVGEPRIREDMMRNETGVADIRYHAEFLEWSAVLTIEFNSLIVSAEQVVHLVELAGYSEGIGGHRPSAPKNCTGDHGRWRITGR